LEPQTPPYPPYIPGDLVSIVPKQIAQNHAIFTEEIPVYGAAGVFGYVGSLMPLLSATHTPAEFIIHE